ncbi:MAG: glycosyltransferase [Clostridia bacterium]
MEEKRLKIGLFIDTFFPMVDGVIMVVDNYARRLSTFSDVTVFAPFGRDKNFDDSSLPYKVVRCKMIKFTGIDYDLPVPSFDYEFKKALKNSNLDIVHIHSPFSLGKEGVAYAKKFKIPCIGTMHSQFKQDFYTATKSKLITSSLLNGIMKVFNACTECWAVNSEVANIFLEYGAKNLPKVQNNGTDISFIEDENVINELREKHNIQKNEKVFLFVGRINKIKNLMFTLESLAFLKKSGFLFKMLFVGSGQDEEEIKNYALKLGLEKEVIFVGKVTDRAQITKYYRLADLFLFPSLYDSSSLVQIEAASQKTPTLFLRGSATSATATEDVNGFFSDNDPMKYSEKIIEIFSNPSYYKKVSDGAYNDLYVSWDKAVAKAYKDYLRLIEQNKENFELKQKIKDEKKAKRQEMSIIAKQKIAERKAKAKEKMAKRQELQKEKKKERQKLSKQKLAQRKLIAKEKIKEKKISSLSKINNKNN